MPGMRPVGIGETNRRALAKLVIRAAGDQAKTACGNLQLCAGLESGIEGETHALGQRQLDRARQRSNEEVARRLDKEEDKDEAAREEELTVETEGTEEEATAILQEALEMEVE